MDFEGYSLSQRKIVILEKPILVWNAFQITKWFNNSFVTLPVSRLKEIYIKLKAILPLSFPGKYGSQFSSCSPCGIGFNFW